MPRRVVIVGAGVVGCAAAYLLARAGFAVTVLDRDGIATHASGRNAGNLNPLHGTPPALLPFAMEAFHSHLEIRAQLQELGCAPCAAVAAGRIYLGYSDGERTDLTRTAALFGATPGFAATWLESRDLRRIEPHLAEDTACGVLAQGNLSVDGREFARSLIDGASRFGGSLLPEAALGMTTRGDHVIGVETRGGVIACDELVLATGPWIAETKSWLGIEVAVKPLKGEMLLVRAPQTPRGHDLTWGETSIYTRAANRIWIGTTMTDCGFDDAPTEYARKTLLARAARMMPAMADAVVLEQLAALRPMSGTAAPIAARAAGWQNVYIANGGAAKGVLLSTRIGSAIVDLLRG